MLKAPPTDTNKDGPEISSNRNSAITDLNVQHGPPVQEEDPFSQLTSRKKKYGSRWKQQNLSAWRNNFGLLCILSLYVSVGVIFMGVGGLCYYYASSYPVPIEKDYTHCTRSSITNNITDPDTNATSDSATGKECFPGPEEGKNLIKRTKSIQCSCKIPVDIDKDNLPEDGRSLIIFFQLTNFHQNLRYYKKDVDWYQIEGKAVNSDNKPQKPQCKVSYSSETKKPIFPCGKVANSYFSDTFKMFDAQGNEVRLDITNIAWEADKVRYKNPSLSHGKKVSDLFQLPKDWHDGLKAEFFDETNKGIENEHFMVWMKTAALDQVRKKYAYIPDLKEAGVYTIQIQYRFEVKSYHGTKQIVIATDPQDLPVDFMFFYLYAAVGGICLLMGPTIYITNRIIHAFHKSSSSSNRPSRTVSEVGIAPPDDPLLADPLNVSHTEMQYSATNNTEQPSTVSIKS